jgi:hypothetical protein
LTPEVAAKRLCIGLSLLGPTDFVRDCARVNLLTFLHDVLDVAAAETYVADCGLDVSMHALRVDETNGERDKTGWSLSGRDEQ